VYVVTGGAGYIGGHLVDYLVSKNNEVLVIDDFSRGSYINPKTKVIKFDLRVSTIEIPKRSIIYHLAAHPDVKDSMLNIIEHFERDVKATLNVMEMARKYDAEKVIYTSSSTVYGESKQIPTSESYNKNPISFYGLFKYLGEEIIRYYSYNYNIKSIVVRLANVIGGRMSHGVIYDFIMKLKKNPNVLEILGNGLQRKSYIYIDDVIGGFITLENKAENTYEEFNLGNEDWITVNEIASIVEEEVGVKPKHVYIDFREGRGWEGDVRFMLLDISKIKRLGWKPKYSSKEAVRLAVRDILAKI
jgi:UDP-glucose 4-epimerase